METAPDGEDLASEDWRKDEQKTPPHALSGTQSQGGEPLGSILPFMKSGRVKFLGVTTLTRYAPIPDTPTLAEQGLPGFEAIPWTMVLAPKGTPAPVVQKLNETIAQVLKEPAVIEDFVRTGSMSLGGSPAAANKYFREEYARWGKAVKESGAQVD